MTTEQHQRPIVMAGWKANKSAHLASYIDRDGYVVTESCRCQIARDHEHHEPPDFPPEPW